MIIGHGMVAFRDPNGIRPLVLGKRDLGDGRTEYMVASESVALDTLGFEFLRDVAPGEAVYITEKGQLFTRQCADNPVSNPCLFEYVYFARPDSFIDKISVYSARVNMGTKLGEKIAREWDDLDIDVVIPIPETSCDIALEIARILDKPYRQGFVKNRYVGRTFIMPGQQLRRKSVRRKLNANRANSATRTFCWWMTPSCAVPPLSRLSRWRAKRCEESVSGLCCAGNSLPERVRHRYANRQRADCSRP
jgi:amidophosphoribosyltransferase